MNLREAWAVTAIAGLGWSPDVERAIDRIAAGGFADETGLALFSARYQNSAMGYCTALWKLKQALRRQFHREEEYALHAIARQTLREYLVEFCTVCLGAKEIVEKKLRVVCHSCDGSGVRKYGERERAENMRLSLSRVRNLHHKMEWAHDFCMRHDRLVNAQLVIQLERA